MNNLIYEEVLSNATELMWGCPQTLGTGTAKVYCHETSSYPVSFIAKVYVKSFVKCASINHFTQPYQPPMVVGTGSLNKALGLYTIQRIVDQYIYILYKI